MRKTLEEQLDEVFYRHAVEEWITVLGRRYERERRPGSVPWEQVRGELIDAIRNHFAWITLDYGRDYDEGKARLYPAQQDEVFRYIRARL